MVQFLPWSYTGLAGHLLGQSSQNVIIWGIVVALVGCTWAVLQLSKNLPSWRFDYYWHFFKFCLYALSAERKKGPAICIKLLLASSMAGLGWTWFSCSKCCGLQSSLCYNVTGPRLSTVSVNIYVPFMLLECFVLAQYHLIKVSVVAYKDMMIWVTSSHLYFPSVMKVCDPSFIQCAG